MGFFKCQLVRTVFRGLIHHPSMGTLTPHRRISMLLFNSLGSGPNNCTTATAIKLRSGKSCTQECTRAGCTDTPLPGTVGHYGCLEVCAKRGKGSNRIMLSLMLILCS